MMKRQRTIGVLVAWVTGWTMVYAHETGTNHEESVRVLQVAPGTEARVGEAGVTGQGEWVFEAIREGGLPVPAEAAAAVRGAHGTLVVDRENDTLYWGLENVGWVAFSNRLSQSWVVEGDPALSRGNLHGADLLTRPGGSPIIAAADNVEGEVYVSDTSFRQVRRLGWPQLAPYTKPEEYHPTDVAFVDGDHLYVTDGYGAAHFLPVNLAPLAYRGEVYGGKSMSATPHGITLDPRDGTLVIAARPEGLLKRWDLAGQTWVEVLGLPSGSTVCDIDIRGDLALAPCLDGPNGEPGPIYIVDLRERSIVSTLRPKADLGFADAQHIHDATWYEAEGEVYVVFTSWNPGGIGALRRRSVAAN